MQFSALFSYMLWHIEFKFCIWLCFNGPQGKFECRHFATIFVGVMPLCELRILEILSFPHFSLTCFDILSWSTTDQVRVSSICVNFCGSYAPFWNLEYWKYTVFRTFLLQPLTYWAESLHITLFFCTTDQVWVSSICVYFRVMPIFELRILFSALFSYTLWHIELKFCTWLCFTVIQVNFECRQWASIFVGEMSLLGLRILEIHSFPHFSPGFFDILSWNFSYNFV